MVCTVLTLIVILALALVSQAEEDQTLAYDLNGRWEVTDALCHGWADGWRTFSRVPSRLEMREQEQSFYSRGYGGELRIVKQIDNDLEIVFLRLLDWNSEPDERLDATLSGDLFRYEGYDEYSDDGKMRFQFKGRGEALSADRIIERLTYTGTHLTGGDRSYFYTCELEVERVFVGTGLLQLDDDEAEAMEEP